MSKGAKSRSKERRRREKAARKAAMKARYESYRDKGINTKSKRYRNNLKDRTVSGFDHPEGHCGNIGCKKCFPDFHRMMEIHQDRFRKMFANPF